MYYKDSALYVAKYEQCLSKLVSLFRFCVFSVGFFFALFFVLYYFFVSKLFSLWSFFFAENSFSLHSTTRNRHTWVLLFVCYLVGKVHVIYQTADFFFMEYIFFFNLIGVIDE